jgi:hypothetical protein
MQGPPNGLKQNENENPEYRKFALALEWSHFKAQKKWFSGHDHRRRLTVRLDDRSHPTFSSGRTPAK